MDWQAAVDGAGPARFEDHMARVAAVLVRYRVDRGITQPEVARRAVISCPTLERLESGTMDSTHGLVWAVLERLEIPLTLKVAEFVTENSAARREREGVE